VFETSGVTKEYELTSISVYWLLPKFRSKSETAVSELSPTLVRTPTDNRSLRARSPTEIARNQVCHCRAETANTCDVLHRPIMALQSNILKIQSRPVTELLGPEPCWRGEGRGREGPLACLVGAPLRTRIDLSPLRIRFRR